MEYLDFSSVITLIRKYINDERTVEDKLLKQEVKNKLTVSYPLKNDIVNLDFLEVVMSNYLNDDSLDCSHALRCMAAFLARTRLKYGIIIAAKAYYLITE